MIVSSSLMKNLIIYSFQHSLETEKNFQTYSSKIGYSDFNWLTNHSILFCYLEQCLFGIIFSIWKKVLDSVFIRYLFDAIKGFFQFDTNFIKMNAVVVDSTMIVNFG